MRAHGRLHITAARSASAPHAAQRAVQRQLNPPGVRLRTMSDDAGNAARAGDAPAEDGAAEHAAALLPPPPHEAPAPLPPPRALLFGLPSDALLCFFTRIVRMFACASPRCNAPRALLGSR